MAKLSGDDSLFSVFEHDHKSKLPQRKAANALNDYIDFCARTISHFLFAVKHDVGNARWTTDRKLANRILTVTYVNAFLITMRKIIEESGSLEPTHLKKRLSGISTFDFKKFHSSQYNRMAEEIYEKHFS